VTGTRHLAAIAAGDLETGPTAESREL